MTFDDLMLAVGIAVLLVSVVGLVGYVVVVLRARRCSTVGVPAAGRWSVTDAGVVQVGAGGPYVLPVGSTEREAELLAEWVRRGGTAHPDVKESLTQADRQPTDDTRSRLCSGCGSPKERLDEDEVAVRRVRRAHAVLRFDADPDFAELRDLGAAEIRRSVLDAPDGCGPDEDEQDRLLRTWRQPPDLLEFADDPAFRTMAAAGTASFTGVVMDQLAARRAGVERDEGQDETARLASADDGPAGPMTWRDDFAQAVAEAEAINGCPLALGDSVTLPDGATVTRLVEQLPTLAYSEVADLEAEWLAQFDPRPRPAPQDVQFSRHTPCLGPSSRSWEVFTRCRDPWPGFVIHPPTPCYSRAGFDVHVRPSCRCPRGRRSW